MTSEVLSLFWQHAFPLVKPRWLCLIASLSPICLYIPSRNVSVPYLYRSICSMMFLGTEVRLTFWYFPGLLFLPFQKHDCDVSLFFTEHGLYLTAVTFQIQCYICQFTQDSGMHLFKFSRWSQTWSSFTMGKSSLSQLMPWDSEAQLEPQWPLKTEANKNLWCLLPHDQKKFCLRKWKLKFKQV